MVSYCSWTITNKQYSTWDSYIFSNPGFLLIQSSRLKTYKADITRYKIHGLHNKTCKCIYKIPRVVQCLVRTVKIVGGFGEGESHVKTNSILYATYLLLILFKSHNNSWWQVSYPRFINVETRIWSSVTCPLNIARRKKYAFIQLGEA